ncbi:unnamed protein product [Lactuca virosa]|uniref:Uncharacterized protein n=1 Tax=Lactuca virosa TaxID=75947 RepID=A0AAU9MCK9_9ASTR|nr:unnamed protein product [Lactuca virosa]
MRTMIERLKMEVFNLCEIVFIIMSPTFTGIGRNDPSSESARVGSSSKKDRTTKSSNRQHHQSPPLTRLFCSFGYDREVEYVYGGSKGLEEESLSLQFTFSVTKKLNFLDCIGNPRRGFLIKKLQWILLSILNAESKRVIYWWRKEYMMLCRRNISRH